MDLRTLTKLLLKLAGLYLLLTAFIGLVRIIVFPIEVGPSVLVLSLYIGAGAWLVWFPGTLLNRILRIEGSELEGTVTASRLMGVGVALLGIYLSISALTALLYTLAGSKWFYRFTDQFGGAQGPDIGPEPFASLVSFSAQLLIGIALWLKWKKVVALTGMKDDR